MEDSGFASNQPIRSQVLHTDLACQPPAAAHERVEVPVDDFPRPRRTMSASARPSNGRGPPERGNGAQRRRPAQPPPLTPEERHQQLLRDFQKRYKFDLFPTITQFRLTSKLAGYRVSADLCKAREKIPYVSLGMKFGQDPLFIKKVVVTPQHSDLRMFTPNMELGFLHLQFGFGFDWCKRTFGASWRCKTKWTRGAKLQRRFKHYTDDRVEVSTFWNVKSELPTMGGQIGSSVASVQTDIGRLSVLEVLRSQDAIFRRYAKWQTMNAKL